MRVSRWGWLPTHVRTMKNNNIRVECYCITRNHLKIQHPFAITFIWLFRIHKIYYQTCLFFTVCSHTHTWFAIFISWNKYFGCQWDSLQHLKMYACLKSSSPERSANIWYFSAYLYQSFECICYCFQRKPG